MYNPKNNNQKDKSLSVKDQEALDLSVLIVEKTKRLSSALYMITAHLSDKDPLKWDIRKKSVEYLGTALSFLNHRRQHIASSELNSIAGRLLSHIDDIIVLLDLALSDPEISKMNFSLVRSEFVKLSETLNNLADKGMSEYFEFNDKLADFVRGQETIKDSISDYKGLNISKGQSIKKTKPRAENSPKQKDKGQRKEKIIAYLKNGGWASIKEISKIIPECSTKTVQRELSDLVDKNVLKKKGDRRWSRYALA